MQAFQDKDLLLSEDLNEMVTNLDNALKSILNDLAPEKQVAIPLKPKQPWYTRDRRTLKHKVRQPEKKWLRHKLDSCWVAYKKQRNLYYAMLNQSKRTTLRSKINDYHGDSKKLHQFINNLTNKTMENLMPLNKSDAELAEEFVSFFKNNLNYKRPVPGYTSI